MPKSRNTPRARELRGRQTDSEGRLWGVLPNRGLGGWKWRRQVPRGGYIVDFYCADALLVVELDGSQHLEAAALAYDRRRTAFLLAEGLRVMRIESGAIFENLPGVCDAILAMCGGEEIDGGSTAIVPRAAL